MGLVTHLFENHELIQEVNTLAGEEFPDGLLCLEAPRVRGGAHLGWVTVRLVPQELCQRVILHIGGREEEIRQEKSRKIKKLRQMRHLFTPQNVCCINTEYSVSVKFLPPS